MKSIQSAVRRAAWAIVLTCFGLGAAGADRGVASAQGAPQAKTEAGSLKFKDTEFFHRWTQAGQHEFTPAGDEDLKAWKEMMTVNVHDRVRDGDALADLANRVLGNYEANGHIMRTISKPRTPSAEAEHFVAAVLQAPNVFEVAFARFLLFEGRGVIVVYSKRFYGTNAQSEMAAWFKANAVPVENALVSWRGIPKLDVLKGLPQSR